jgi:hypothetical protein
MAIITKETVEKLLPEDKVRKLIEQSGNLQVTGVAYSVSHPDDKITNVTLIISVEREEE